LTHIFRIVSLVVRYGLLACLTISNPHSTRLIWADVLIMNEI
jgi:hypothetical protein